MKLLINLALATGLLMPASNLVADVLLLDSIAQAPPNNAQGLSRPTRSMSMNEVRLEFGEPNRAMPWVGDPPITRWLYEDFTVYFENDRVITSVVNH